MMREIPLSPKSWEQVFALPELIELILLHLDSDLPPPCLQLWTLQRVNRDFRDTIGRTRELQERMLLAHRHEDPDGIDMYSEDIIALTWLTDHMPFTIPTLRKPVPNAIWPKHVGATLGTLMLHVDVPESGKPRPNEERIRRFKRPEASWRRMKIARLDLKAQLSMDLELYDYQARLTDGKGRSTTRLQIEAETLGELFDVVEEIRCRTPEQHITWEKRPKEGVVNPPNVREIFMAEDFF